MRRILTFLVLLLPLLPGSAYALGFTNQNFATQAQIIGAGGTVADLLNDTKLYLTGNGLTLSASLTAGAVFSSTVPSLYAQLATPANPGAGFDKCYVKADDKFYCLSSAGVESLVGPTAASSGGGGWSTLGNLGTDPTTDFLGTIDAVDLVLRTGSAEQLRLISGGAISATADLNPSLSNTYNLGSALLNWKDIHSSGLATFNNVLVNGSFNGAIATAAAGESYFFAPGNRFMEVVLAGAASDTNLRFNSTANRVIDMPDATDTLVGRATTDTLTNKSIDAGTNTITGITDTSIAAAGTANIARDKLASGTANEVVINDPSGVMTSEAHLATSRGGTNHGDYTAGSVPFAGAGGTVLTEDNSDFFWDNTLKRLGLGINTPAATLDVLGRVNQSVSATDSGLSGLQFSVTTDTTVNGSNTTIGLQGVATATAQVGATNDKAVAAVMGTTQRGNGADDGVVHEMDGPYGILMHNSGAAGVTDKAIGMGFTLIQQQGTITDLYDFKPDSVPAGGTVTNHYGLYVANSPFGGVKNSWIGDRTVLGGTSYSAPTVELDVNGAARVRALTTAGPVQTDASGNLTSTATLPIAIGGTNGATATAGFDNLSPLTTKGDILTHDGTNNVRFAVCPDGQNMQADSAQVSGWKCVTPSGGGGGTDFPVTAYTADATITNAEYDVYLDPASGTGVINITLFAATGNPGHHLNFVQISEGTVNYFTVGGETIGFDGDTDAQTNAKGNLTIGSNGSNWYVH